MQMIVIKDEFKARHHIEDKENQDNPEIKEHSHYWRFTALVSMTKEKIDVEELHDTIKLAMPDQDADLNKLYDVKNLTIGKVATKLYDKIQEVIQSRFSTSIVALELYDTESTGIMHDARV